MSSSFRMPATGEEAKAVYDRWDRLNGRYYIKADVRLTDGTYWRDMVFDGDSYVAVEAARRPLYEQPALFGREILAFLVTRDRSAGRHFKDASPEERAAFEKSA